MEELTRLEERIMQCIWNYQGEVPFLDLIEMVKEKLNKDYKRTSIRGYLFRLEEKGYIKVTKKGRKAYVQPLINEESYDPLDRTCNFKYISTLLKSICIDQRDWYGKHQ